MSGFGRTSFPPSPYLVIKDPLTQSSRILVEPHPIDAEFRKAWMPCFSKGLVILLLLLTSFGDLCVIFASGVSGLIFLGLRVGIVLGGCEG